MAFYARICDNNSDIKSCKLPTLFFVTKQNMLDTLDECYDLIVSVTKDSMINIFEKELLKQHCVGACYRTGTRVFVVMTNDKFNSQTIQKLVIRLKNLYSSTFIQADLDNFIKDSQDIKFDKIDMIKHQIDEIKGIMIQNIDELLKRGESIESLLDKSNQLNDDARKFGDGVKKMNSRCGRCVLS